ncbi:hypothetical protein ES705_38774 [subsurface metagenome]
MPLYSCERKKSIGVPMKFTTLKEYNDKFWFPERSSTNIASVWFPFNSGTRILFSYAFENILSSHEKLNFEKFSL